MHLRIAMWSNFFKPIISGVVTSVSLFRQGLLEQGHDVHIFTTEAENYEDPDPYIYRLPALLDLTESFEFSLALPVRWPMLYAMKGIKPHVIHSQHPVLLGDLAARYAQEFGLPLVFTFHTRYDEFMKSNFPLISGVAVQLAHEVLRDYLAQCTHIIAPTPSVQEMIYADYDVDVPVTVLPTPIDLAQYNALEPDSIRAQYGLQDKHVLLYLGRISQEKSIDLLLHMLSHLVERRSDVVLMIVGRGPQSEELEELAQELHIDERVVFTGAVSHEQVPHYMAAADLFTFPSIFETQGLVLIEALAAGTPVVAVRAMGATDVLVDTDVGVLVDHNALALAAAVDDLLDRPERLAEMRRAALDFARAYSISAATERLVGVYEQAMADGPHVLKRHVFSRN
ncbi:MAG: glycosyltransferase [Anaerolineae bacterium]|nr:glycosyltransferase [Anaerolineae bacterium]